MMFTAIKRYLIILLAYLLTVFIAAFGASAAIYISSSPDHFNPSFSVFLGFAALFIGIFASLPAALVICLGEYWPIKSKWYYIAAAVLFGVALAYRFMTVTAWWLLIVGAVLGIAAGSAYWAVAGKNAGVLKTTETAQAHTLLLLLLGSTVGILAMVMILLWR